MTENQEPSKGRRAWEAIRPWLAVAVAAVVIFAIVLWWIEDARLTLDYLKALVWPGLVGGVLYWLRDPLKAKVGQLLKVGFGSANVEFLNDQFERNVEDAATTLQAEDTLEITVDDTVSTNDSADITLSEASPSVPVNDAGMGDDPGSPKGVTSVVAEVASESDSAMGGTRKRESSRRRAIEQIIEESAGWGYDMAHIGFKNRPVPKIAWTDDGRPLILYGEGESPSPARPNYDPRIKARNLERVIADLERDLKNPMRVAMVGAIGGIGRDEADQARLKDLKRRLAALDPNSAYLD